MPGSKRDIDAEGPRRVERPPRRHGHPVREGRSRQPDDHRPLRRRALLQQPESVASHHGVFARGHRCGGWRRCWRWCFANGFFVAAEFSIVTVRKTRIDQLIAEGHRGARAVRRAVSDPDALHRRDAARHHDGEPGPRVDRRAGAGGARFSRRSRFCPVHDRRSRPRTASPSRSRSRSSPPSTSCSASWRRRRSRSSGRRRRRCWSLSRPRSSCESFWPFITAAERHRPRRS